MTHQAWPELPYEAWEDTRDTLHMWTQIVGKIRLAKSPWVNHSWHVTLYVTSRGLTTSPIPDGQRTFEIDFDFISHELTVRTSDGQLRAFGLEPRSVAGFYELLMTMLKELEIEVEIDRRPNEVDGVPPFDQDEEHDSYDREHAGRFFHVLSQTDRVFEAFRSRFIGKVSPVHFFWGSFDLAVTRFSGRKAPVHPGGIPNLADWVTREAYSHEVSSAGFWPGGAAYPHPIFYSYAYPAPSGFGDSTVGPEGATFADELGEFVLPYDVVRAAADPDAALMEFLETTYRGAADLGKWDRDSLEVRDPWPPRS
ncbi:MAG TPA: DUF5996 family protein [Vicinamibacteria bacterium]|nr:DUF5996 family protein [Vicinamibacteria bacterium]